MRAAVFQHIRPRRCLYHILDYVGTPPFEASGTTIICPFPSVVVDSTETADRYAQEDLSCIIRPWLYLSGLMGVRARNLPVRRIISIGVNLTDFDKYHHPNGAVEYHAFPLEDAPGAPLLDVLSRVLILLDTNIPTLVHCQMGMSRSASCVIAYIMRQYWRQTVGDVVLDPALKIRRQFQWRLYHFCHDLVKHRRPCIRPNKGFEKTLKNDIEVLHAV